MIRTRRSHQSHLGERLRRSFLAANGILTGFEIIGPVPFVIILVLSFFVFGAIEIAHQWERAVVLRMGRFHGLKGPGFFLIIPIVDRIDKYLDQRVRVTDFSAETTLTRDTVPVNVDAVVYWTVWDVQKAVLEVQDYKNAVFFVAQTGLRDIIGRHELSDLLQHRDKIAEALQDAWTSTPIPGASPARGSASGTSSSRRHWKTR